MTEKKTTYNMWLFILCVIIAGVACYFERVLLEEHTYSMLMFVLNFITGYGIALLFLLFTPLITEENDDDSR